MHNVKTMFYAGEVPWHGLGTKVDTALNSAEALKKASLDWDVLSEPVYDRFGKLIPNSRANIRSSDRSVFGIVSERYKIVQNKEAFSFTDFLLKNDMGIKVTYETAGALDGGKRVWMLANLPPERVLGDDIVPYLVFSNSHDGKGSIIIAVTPTRVVCQNTLNIALTTAPRKWSTRHIGNMEGKMAEAEATLLRTKAYMGEIKANADILQQVKINSSILQEFLDQVFPMKIDASLKQQDNNDSQRDEFLQIYSSKPDLKKFKDTGWGLYNALADFESHSEPLRLSGTFKERRFESFVDGNTRLQVGEEFLMGL